MSTETTTVVPGYVAGTWTIDPVHSEVGFSVRHMMVSKVRGKFASFEGSIVTGENPLDSTVTATVDLASIDTGNADRDAHIRSADFFDVERHPTLTFRSTGVRRVGDDEPARLHGGVEVDAEVAAVDGGRGAEARPGAAVGVGA